MIEIKVDGHTLFEMNTPKDAGLLQEQLKATQGHYNALLTEIANVRDVHDAKILAQEAEIEQLRKSENVQYMQEILHDLEALRADAERLKGMLSAMDWDGNAYWLPEWCIRERGFNEHGDVPEPTLDEFRAAIDGKITKEATK